MEQMIQVMLYSGAVKISSIRCHAQIRYKSCIHFIYMCVQPLVYR